MKTSLINTIFITQSMSPGLQENITEHPNVTHCHIPTSVIPVVQYAEDVQYLGYVQILVVF